MKKYLLILLLVYLPQLATAQLKVEPIAEKVYRLSFPADQTSVTATLVRDGNNAVLIDAMYGEYGEAIAAYLKNEKLNLMYVINTHYHGDHTAGNVNYKGIPKIAHTNTKKLIEDKAQYGPSAGFKEEDHPTQLFDDVLVIQLNEIRIDLMHYGHGHTAGDVIVFIPESNVVVVGDLILDAKSTLPFFAKPEAGLSVLEKLAEDIDDSTQVVTGHGQVGSKADIHALIDIINKTVAYVKAGNNLEKFPEEWNTWDSGFLSMTNWLKMLSNLYK